MKILMLSITITAIAMACDANNPNCRYDYSSIADRIHKEVQVKPVDPVGEIRERVKPADPYQDILNDVYGGSQKHKG